jgi:hypothetical protein
LKSGAANSWALPACVAQGTRILAARCSAYSPMPGASSWTAAPDLRSAQTAMRSGIGLVARDRVGESVAPGMAIRENAFLNPSATGRASCPFCPRA